MGIIVAYDCTSDESFKSINYWLKNIREKASKEVIIYLVGNKSDLEDEKVISTN